MTTNDHDNEDRGLDALNKRQDDLEAQFAELKKARTTPVEHPGSSLTPKDPPQQIDPPLELPTGQIQVAIKLVGSTDGTFLISVTRKGVMPGSPNPRPFAGDGARQTWSRLASGRYEIRVEDPVPAGWRVPKGRRQEVELKKGERQTVEFEFTREPDTGSILVRSELVGASSPPPSFQIEVTDAAGIAVPNGMITLTGHGAEHIFANLPPGSYTVKMTPPTDWTTTPLTRPVTVTAGKLTKEVFTSTYDPALGSIKVTVTSGRTGTDTFRIDINGTTKSVKTGGTASWPNLLPGTYTIKATPPGTAWIVPSDQTVELKSGENIKRTVRFDPVAPTGSIVVTKCIVGDESGIFLISVKDSTDKLVGTKEFHGPNARQTWSGLAAGDYTISESDPGPGWLKAGDQVVDLAAGQVVNVTVTNYALPDQLATAVDSALKSTNVAITTAERRLRDIAAAGGRGSGGGAPDGASARKKVDQALARVLGRAVGNDPYAFQAAISGTFPEAGATGEIVRRPVRSYVGSDGGSKQLAAHQDVLRREIQPIVEQAGKELAAIEQALPRFASTNREAEEAKALVKLIRSDLDRLVDEVNRVDRPRRPRVDGLLNALLEQHASLSEMANVSPPATPEEEQLDAGLQLLGRHLDGLCASFGHYNTAAGPGSGSVTVQLASMDLLFGNVLQAVDDLRAAMDAVGLSQIECRTATIEVDGETISIEDILSWVESLAETEGPDLIASGGRWGLGRVRGAAESALAQVETLYQRSETAPAPHVGLTYQTVQDALAELVGSLRRLAAAPDRQPA